MNENQTSFPSGAEAEEIDLIALVVTLLHKIKPILLTALVCAVIFGGAAGIKAAKGSSVSAEDQNAYNEALTVYKQKKKDYEFAQKQYELDVKSNESAQTDVQEALAQAQDYAENSLLGKLDAYNVWTAEASVYVDTGYKIQPGSLYQDADHTDAVLSAYSSQLTNGSSMEQTAETVGLQAEYLTGAVSVEASQNPSGQYNGVMILKAYAADQEMAENILNAMLDQMNALHDSIADAVVSHSVRIIGRSVSKGVSGSLRTLQQENNANIQDLQNQLVELQNARQSLDDNLETTRTDWESAEEPVLSSSSGSASSVVKYLLIGFLLGGVLACGVYTVKFLMGGMVYSSNELSRSTGLPVLGALASDRTRKAGKLDAKLNRMEGRPDGSTDAEMLCLMAQTIRSRAPEAQNILVTGDLPSDQLEALAAALQATEALRSQKVTAADSILKTAATVPHVVAADAIVLAVDCTITHTSSVREQNEKIARLGKKILGCVVYE